MGAKPTLLAAEPPSGVRVAQPRVPAALTEHSLYSRSTVWDAPQVLTRRTRHKSLRGDRKRSAVPATSAPGLGLIPVTSAPVLGPLRQNLRRDWAHPCHICAGTGLTPATSAPGLGSPLPHLRRDCRRKAHERYRASPTDWSSWKPGGASDTTNGFFLHAAALGRANARGTRSTDTCGTPSTHTGCSENAHWGTQ